MDSQPSPDTRSSAPADLSPGEIDAIVSLLADGDERTDAKIVAHLLERSPASRQAVLERAEAAGVWVQMRLAPLIRQRQREDLAQRFQELPRDSGGEVDLEAAAFLVARIGMADFDTAACRRRLDAWADDVHMATPSGDDPGAPLEAFLDVFFKRLGFGGDHDNYYQPQNSFLPYVMDHRSGLPITLSVLALLVAKRAGLALTGIGAPGHFLLRYDALDTPIYVDAFEGGELLTEADALEKIGHPNLPVSQCLPDAGANSIITRMLRNLGGAYQRLNDDEGVADCQVCLDSFLLATRFA